MFLQKKIFIKMGIGLLFLLVNGMPNFAYAKDIPRPHIYTPKEEMWDGVKLCGVGILFTGCSLAVFALMPRDAQDVTYYDQRYGSQERSKILIAAVIGVFAGSMNGVAGVCKLAHGYYRSMTGEISIIQKR